MDDGAEEHVYDEGIDSSFVVHVQNSPEVLDCFRSLFVVHRQNELEESLVVHLSLHSWVLLEDTVNHDRGEAFGVLCEVFLA